MKKFKVTPYNRLYSEVIHKKKNYCVTKFFSCLRHRLLLFSIITPIILVESLPVQLIVLQVNVGSACNPHEV